MFQQPTLNQSTISEAFSVHSKQRTQELKPFRPPDPPPIVRQNLKLQNNGQNNAKMHPEKENVKSEAMQQFTIQPKKYIVVFRACVIKQLKC